MFHLFPASLPSFLIILYNNEYWTAIGKSQYFHIRRCIVSLTLRSNDLQNRSINLLENSIRMTLPPRRTRILVKMDQAIVKRLVFDRVSQGFN